MKKFILKRTEDESGVSGTGIVADGIEWDDGKVVIHWRKEPRATGLYNNVEDLLKVHGHNGKTIVIYDEENIITEKYKEP